MPEHSTVVRRCPVPLLVTMTSDEQLVTQVECAARQGVDRAALLVYIHLVPKMARPSSPNTNRYKREAAKWLIHKLRIVR